MKTTKKRTISTDYLIEALYNRIKSYIVIHLLSKNDDIKHTTVFSRLEEVN
ncbi:MAG: hypothetical protein NWP87_05610 [Winogradskyella sp.]|nr:hypothetical protein [Winogradskyella sp.]